MSKVGKSGDAELSALKALLVDDERQDIQELRKQIETLQSYAGSHEEFSATLSDVLLETLDRLQASDPKSLTRTLSPSVVTSIKREISNSRDDMVEALYPITGRMVSASVKSAMQKLTDDINQRFDSLTSPEYIIAKIKSRATGRPISDFTMVGQKSAEISQILLIEKASGISVAYWSDENEAPTDKDMVSGLLSAISTFAEETYKNDTDTELRTIDLNGKQLAIRHSARHLLAIDFTGVLKSEQKEAIDQAFFALVEEVDTQEDGDPAPSIEDIATNLNHAPESQQGSSKGIYIIGLLLFGVLGYFGVQKYFSWQFNNKIENIRSAVVNEQDLNAFPIEVSGDYEADEILMSGIVPQSFRFEAFRAGIDGLDLDDTQIKYQLNYMINESNVDSSAQRLNENIDQLKTSLESQSTTTFDELNSLAKLLDETQASNNSSRAIAERKIDELKISIEELKQEMKAAADRQQSLTGGLSNVAKSVSEISNSQIGAQESLKSVSDKASQTTLSLEQFSQAVSHLARQVEENQSRLAGFVQADRERLLKTKIYFGNGVNFSDASSAGAMIDEVALIVRRNNFKISVDGYSDPSGPETSNVAVSQRRSKIIVDQLLGLGVDKSLITSRGLGSRRPLSVRVGEEKLNRRVEFSLVE